MNTILGSTLKTLIIIQYSDLKLSISIFRLFTLRLLNFRLT
jgi:hypothetical protein